MAQRLRRIADYARLGVSAELLKELSDAFSGGDAMG